MKIFEWKTTGYPIENARLSTRKQFYYSQNYFFITITHTTLEPKSATKVEEGRAEENEKTYLAFVSVLAN